MVNIVIVGAGGMGNVHYMCYQEIKAANVMAVVGTSDNDRNRAAEWNVPVYSTVDEAILNHNVDVFDICTPTFTHYELCKSVLTKGIDVICEKPLSLSSREAARLFDIARDNACHLYVAHVVQFMDATKVLRDFVKDERYGKPLDAVFERLSEVPRWSNGWMFDKKKGGLLPYDLHIHDLDLMISLFGRPEGFSFTTSSGNGQYEEQYRFNYTYHGLNVVAEAAWFNAQIPFTARWRVYFENGLLVNDGERVIGYPAQGDIEVFVSSSQEDAAETGINVSDIGMYHTELEHFIDCIVANQETPYVSEQQVINVLEQLELMIKE